jgi:sortase A
MTHTATADSPADPAPPTKPAMSSGDKVRFVLRGIGQTLITLGLVVLLFVVYEVWITNLFSERANHQLEAKIQKEWQNNDDPLLPLPGGKDPTIKLGTGIGNIYLPRLGRDYHFAIVEGVDQDDLAIGPGHYPGTALPGEIGNFAVAGHRVGKGAPFNDLDLLNSCDSIIVETQTDFFVYKVLPHDDEITGWATGKGKDPKCAGVSTLRDPNLPNGGVYSQTSGRKIVLPSQGDAVNPVPYQAVDVIPTASQIALLTLTTCNPQFSDKQRLIITSVLVRQVPKSQVKSYGDLLSKLGEAS